MKQLYISWYWTYTRPLNRADLCKANKVEFSYISVRNTRLLRYTIIISRWVYYIFGYACVQ